MCRKAKVFSVDILTNFIAPLGQLVGRFYAAVSVSVCRTVDR